MADYAWATRVPAVPRSETKSLSKGDRLALEHGGQFSALLSQPSTSGRRVDLEAALQHSVVWACIQQTAQTIASLPLQLYSKGSDGNRTPLDDRLTEILTVSPNADQTALEHWEGQVAWLMANGNCYAERVYTGRRLTALEPLAALRCEPIVANDGRKNFEYRDRGKREVLPANKVLHIKGFGFGGLKGMSSIRYGLNSFGAGIAADEAASRHFANGMMPSGTIKYDDSLTPEQREQFQDLLQKFSSSRNAGKVLLLEGGMEYAAVTLNPEDAQLLETRRFSVEDMCRWFGVPPVVIGHAAQGQTMWGTGVEQILMSWMSRGLNPLMRRIEARLLRDVISPEAGRRAYAEWNREGILQMESKAKAEFLKTLVNSGLMTPNEARQKLNLPKAPCGDTLLVQGAMISLEELLSRQGGPTPEGNVQ